MRIHDIVWSLTKVLLICLGVILLNMNGILWAQNVELVGTYDTQGYARAVIPDGTRMWVAVDTKGLIPLDITDPAHPLPSATFAIGGTTYDGIVAGSLLIVAHGTDGVFVYDITNPSIPSLVKHANAGGDARAVARDTYSVYVPLGTTKKLQVLSAASYSLKGFYNTIKDALTVTEDMGYTYVAAGKVYRSYTDVSGSPYDLSEYTPLGIDARDASARNGLVAVAAGTAGLRLVEATSMAEYGHYDTPGDTRAVSFEGNNRVWIADATSIRVINVADPAAPVLSGSYTFPSGAVTYSIEELDVIGNLAHVAAGNGGYAILRYAQATPTPSPTHTPSPTPTRTRTPTPFLQDLNRDGKVNDQDLFIFMEGWGLGE